MRGIVYLGSFMLCLSGFVVSGACKAIAATHEVSSVPRQRCGPYCVLETVVCDTEAEAKGVAAEQFASKIYRVKDSERYFVDYQVTELEASLI